MKHSMSKRSFVFLLVMLLGSVASAKWVHAQSTPSLVGTWRLVSMNIPDANGALRPYWDDRPSGLIIYTADGQMAAQVYDTRRPRLEVPWQSASPDAASIAFRGLSTYFGTYSVDTKAQTVTHTVEGAMVQDWVGTRLVRRYRFLAPDRIELSVVPDAQIVSTGLVLVWQRVP